MIDDALQPRPAPDGVGTLWGLSVGPGAPDLLTLRAHRILTTAPVVAWPACRPGGSSYAWRIVRQYVDPSRQEQLGLVFPMSKDWSQLIPVWQESARTLLAHLHAGRDVAFVTTGDVMLYSTFLHLWEVIEELDPAVPVLVVPGVSSLTAAAALAGVPLGQGDERLSVIPATWHEDHLREVLETTETVVFMKVARVLPRLIAVLEQTGRIGQAVLVSRGTAEQQIVTRDLRRFADRRLNYLSLVLVARRRSFLDRLRAEAAEASVPPAP
ncbi:MAG: precorrin-2 C(20)-methyltransferase, partial [Deltaproteobacteria bacterium]